MIKIGKNISEFSMYSCQPTTKDELSQIIIERISKEGPKCDLNDIDVSQITDMSLLFYKSEFNGDISRWNVSNVKSMYCMFAYSNFNGDISKWNVCNTKDMSYMFEISKFNQNISSWKINKNCDTMHMFERCPIKEEYKPILPE